jgi:hypothetical protein
MGESTLTVTVTRVAPPKSEPSFPPTIRIAGRLYVRQSDGERYKAQLIAYALGIDVVEPPPVITESLIPITQFAKQLGFGRRTAGRRIRAAREAAESVETAIA